MNVRALFNDVRLRDIPGQTVHLRQFPRALGQDRCALLESIGFGYFGTDFLRLNIHFHVNLL
ncbi:hypothetical protein GCM10023346_40690 [Arthrobacter gyeryongensis]|uniref:Uncharacterized protein n=1 Tax=Arthrobacter gyeryongensis TaxID=1650592 RepID=A0ABP9SNT3_9MICC